MIAIANIEQKDEIKALWKLGFPQEDVRYTEYYFKYLFKPENCYVNVVDGVIVSSLIRAPHTLMLHGQVLRTSMILGVVTHPKYRHQGYMKQLMNAVLDACEHTELVTLIQAYEPKLYTPFGFRMIYDRQVYTLKKADVKRTSVFGCSYTPSPLDLLKVYSAFIRRFDGFYPRDLDYFVKYKREIQAEGGKIVACYNEKDQIVGYATLLPDGQAYKVEELVYLDALTLLKLLNSALQEKDILHVHVSKSENLSKIFPKIQGEVYGSTMAKLNDAHLFSKLYEHKVTNVQEAFALGDKPLNLNEFA